MTTSLEGVKVLDFGRYIAGPYCAYLLGELGADVIRVERPRGSEDRFIAPIAGDGSGGLYLHCNRGKRGMTLDPTTPTGREIVKRLARTADVVVANLPAASLESMGLDHASLSRENPRIVLALVTAFGARGPYAERVGFDGIGQAMSGSMHLSGLPDAPAKSITNYVDFATATAAALGTVAALLEREKTGKGKVVEASLLGSALALMGPTLVEEGALGIGRVGTGNRSQLSGPSDTYRTRDGFVLVQTVGQPIFARWARLMGETAWLEDPRYADDLARGKNGAALSDRMQAWCSTRTTAEALAELERARVPSGPVYSPREALDDPHVKETLLVETTYPGIEGPVTVPRSPLGAGQEPPGPAPVLGEHTDAILRDLGFSESDIVEARRNGSV